MKGTRTTLNVPTEYVAIDVETTGFDLDFCEVIEVSAVKVSNGDVVGTYTSLVRPNELPIPQYIEDMTGIKSSDLEDAPLPDDAFGGFFDLVGTLPVVGHNVCFDAGFVSKYAKSEFDNELIDTMRISRHVMKNLKKHRLVDVYEECSKCGAREMPEGSSHRAEYDALMAAACFETMKPMLVALYGDDPDAGYKGIKRNCEKTISKEYIDGLVPTVEVDEDNPFYGSVVCFTGKLSTMERAEAMQKAVNLGAEPKTGVTKKVNYLVVGSFDFVSNLNGNKSSKLKKAEEYAAAGCNIQIISESFFLKYAQDV